MAEEPTERLPAQRTEQDITVHEIGNSEGPTIPADWREDLGIEKGTKAAAVCDTEERKITYFF